jgi:hypothetical protein
MAVVSLATAMSGCVLCCSPSMRAVFAVEWHHGEHPADDGKGGSGEPADAEHADQYHDAREWVVDGDRSFAAPSNPTRGQLVHTA